MSLWSRVASSESEHQNTCRGECSFTLHLQQMPTWVEKPNTTDEKLDTGAQRGEKIQPKRGSKHKSTILHFVAYSNGLYINKHIYHY